MNDLNSFPEIDIKNIPRPVLRRSQARYYTDEEIQNSVNVSDSTPNLLNYMINNVKYNFVTYCDNNPVYNNNNFPKLLPILKHEDYITDFINNKTPSPRKINEKKTQTEDSTYTKPTLKRNQSY